MNEHRTMKNHKSRNLEKNSHWTDENATAMAIKIQMFWWRNISLARKFTKNGSMINVFPIESPFGSDFSNRHLRFQPGKAGKTWHISDFDPKMSGEQWKKTWLFRVYRGWDTTQLYGDYNKPLEGSLLNNQYFMESRSFFFRGSGVYTILYRFFAPHRWDASWRQWILIWFST